MRTARCRCSWLTWQRPCSPSSSSTGRRPCRPSSANSAAGSSVPSCPSSPVRAPYPKVRGRHSSSALSSRPVPASSAPRCCDDDLPHTLSEHPPHPHIGTRCRPGACCPFFTESAITTHRTSSLPENSDPPTDRHRHSPAGPWFGPLLRRLHFYAGILIGPFILIAALSGALYALSPQLEKIVYADQLTTSTSGPSLPLTEQIEAANAVVGDEDTLSAVRPAPEPGTTTRLMYADPQLGESESRAIFIDPTTAEVTGDLTVYGTSGALPLRTWIDQLHRSLHLGDVGRLYSELAASWLGIVAVAGLVLWVIRARKTRRLAAMLRPERKHRGLRRTFSWHASVGVWAAIGMLFLSATGITWSQLGGENVTKLRAALSWETPAISTELGDTSAGDEHTHHHDGSSSAEATAPAIDPA